MFVCVCVYSCPTASCSTVSKAPCGPNQAETPVFSAYTYICIFPYTYLCLFVVIVFKCLAKTTFCTLHVYITPPSLCPSMLLPTCCLIQYIFLCLQMNMSVIFIPYSTPSFIKKKWQEKIAPYETFRDDESSGHICLICTKTSTSKHKSRPRLIQWIFISLPISCSLLPKHPFPLFVTFHFLAPFSERY